MVDGIQCTRCGWHNEPTAIMCGGCGQPLRSSRPAYPPPATASWAQAATGSPATPGPQRLSGPQGAPTWPMAGGWAPTAAPPTAAPAPPRQSSCLPGCLWSLLIALLLGIVLVAAAWSLAVRPPLHAQADGALAKGIGALVAGMPAVPEQALQVTGPTITVSEASTNDTLQQASATSGTLNWVTVRYEPGVVRVHYAVRGNGGDITLQPRVRNGQLAVENVHVSGILGWIESGPELQATLNRELAPLSGKTPHGFAAVSVVTGELTVTLKTA